MLLFAFGEQILNGRKSSLKQRHSFGPRWIFKTYPISFHLVIWSASPRLLHCPPLILAPSACNPHCYFWLTWSWALSSCRVTGACCAFVLVSAKKKVKLTVSTSAKQPEGSDEGMLYFYPCRRMLQGKPRVFMLQSQVCSELVLIIPMFSARYSGGTRTRWLQLNLKELLHPYTLLLVNVNWQYQVCLSGAGMSTSPNLIRSKSAGECFVRSCSVIESLCWGDSEQRALQFCKEWHFQHFLSILLGLFLFFCCFVVSFGGAFILLSQIHWVIKVGKDLRDLIQSNSTHPTMPTSQETNLPPCFIYCSRLCSCSENLALQFSRHRSIMRASEQTPHDSSAFLTDSEKTVSIKCAWLGWFRTAVKQGWKCVLQYSAHYVSYVHYNSACKQFAAFAVPREDVWV